MKRATALGLIAALVLISLGSTAVCAQDSIGVIRLTISDAGSGRPLENIVAGLPREGRGWEWTDDRGRAILPVYQAGTHRLFIECPRPRGVWGAPLDTLSFLAYPGLDTTIAQPVDYAKCGLPEFSVRRVRLSGHYLSAFETDRFFPAPDSLGRPRFWGGHPSSRHARVMWTEIGRAQRPHWPIDSVASEYCFHVEWVGTLAGPGRADHPEVTWRDHKRLLFGGRVAAYTLAIDSTVSVRKVELAHCKRT